MQRGGLVLVLFFVSLAPAAAHAQITFEGPFGRAVSGRPGSAAAADFDGDGLADVVVADTANSEVLLFPGPGGGLFPDPVRFGAGPSPSGLVARDLDGDGRADVAAADLLGNDLTLLFGNGRGGFDRSSSVPAGGSNPADVVVLDFDRDGTLDLAAVLYPDVILLRGVGGGAFVRLGPIGVPAASSALIAGDSADFDGDGSADLAVVSLASSSATSPSEAYVFLNDGSGGFTLAFRFFVDAGATASADLLAADLDGDGRPDLAFADRVRGGVFVHWNAGGGTFAARGLFATGGRATALAEADFDLDGVLDLAAANGYPDVSAGVLPGDGTGAFGPPVRLDAAANPRGIAVGDFNGDSLADVAVSVGGNAAVGSLAAHYNATPLTCRAGNVNAGRGSIVDVLFVNDSAGGSNRRVELLTFEPLTVFVAAPPASMGLAPFALAAWRGEPTVATVRTLPFGLGQTCFPLLAGDGSPRPAVLWNNTGRAVLGAPTRPSSPAPSVVFSRPSGAGRALTFFVQGIVADPGSAARRPASVTNGVTVEVR